MEPHEGNIIEQMLTLVSAEEDGSYTGGASEAVQQVKKFIDDIPGGFFVYHAEGDERLIFANKAMLKIFRCDTMDELRELTGNSFKGIVYPEDLEAVEQSIKEQIAASQDDLDYVEYRIIAKDGSVRWVEDYGHFLRRENIGNIFYVFITDATEKINKRKQEHLQRLEVIEGLSVNYDSILYVDLKKDKVYPYRLSERLIPHFTKKLQEREYLNFVEDYVKTCVHPEDKQNIAEKLAPEYIVTALAENKTYYINLRCIQNGETQYLQLRLVNVGEEGNVSQVVIGCRNIDEEVLQQMKQKQLLEEALHNAHLAFVAKNTFLSNMSHDLRTPLNAIFGYAALAKKNLKDAGLAQNYLDKIETAGRSILELVDNVLEISYMESQDFHISEAECNLHDIIQQVYRAALPAAAKKEIAISLHSSALKHGDVYADKEKLKQVLGHIVGNAVKYTKNGGKVDITVTEQKTSSDVATFAFIVQDTGIGIEQETIKNIFEPFERGQNTTHSGVYGSGLGLTIAKHIVETLNGTIDCQSTVGKGSTFTVTVSFKLQSTDESEAADTEKLLNFLKGKKILLVEDNEINLEIETEMLQDLELDVQAAENGKKAVDVLAAAKEDEYLFVLMDIQMPVMDGRQAAENIRKLSGKVADIPIIALSANAFEVDKRLSMEAGMNDHITKPLEIPVMLKAIAKVIKY